MEDQELISYYKIAEDEMKHMVEEFNKKVSRFWLQYDLYPVFNQSCGPLGWDNKPITDHIIYRRLDVLQNPTKLLVELKEEPRADEKPNPAP